MGLITKYRMSFLPPSRGMPYTRVPNTTPLATDPSVAAEHTTAPLDELQQVNSRNQTPDELKTQRLNKFLKNRLKEDKAQSMADKQLNENRKLKQQDKLNYENSLLGRFNKARQLTRDLFIRTGQSGSMLGSQSIAQQQAANRQFYGNPHEEDNISDEDFHRQSVLRNLNNLRRQRNNP